MNFCTFCVMPDTKPDLTFNEDGVCNACQNYINRQSIDWQAKQAELEELFVEYRNRSNGSWDCIVPVSGGKDSTFQVLTALRFGMTPLCVTATTCSLTEIGRANIENIKSLGVDLIEFSPNPEVRRKLNRIGLEEVGDISWPEHVGIFTIPVRVAVQFSIPLIIWGENSQNEYGGPPGSTGAMHLDRRWLEEFGGLLGLRVSDLTENFGFSRADLLPYVYPTASELERASISGIFLGSFIPWDGLSNLLIAQAHGFQSFGRAVEGAMVDYENLDNYQVGIHEYFKFLKFGFGRATDHACLHIRRGRISRAQGVEIVSNREGKFPWSYMDRPLESILSEIDLDVDQFEVICDRFTNRDLFVVGEDGRLVKDRNRNLTRRFRCL